MKFEMTRAWNDAMALLGMNRQVVLIVAGVFFFLPYLAMALLVPEFLALISGTGQAAEPGNVSAATEEMLRTYREVWWAILLVSLAQAIGMLSLVALLTDHDRPTVSQALTRGAKYFLPYLGTQILIGIPLVILVMIPFAVGAAAGAGAGVLVGVVTLVLLAYLMTKFSLSLPVVVIDGKMNPISVLSRSWALTKGNSLRLFGFYCLLVLVAGVISSLVSILVGVITALSGDDAALIIAGLLNALFNLAAVTIMLAVLAAVHRQLSGNAPEVVGATFE